MARARVLGLCGISLVAAACSSSDKSESVGASEAAHTEGDLAWSNEPYFWTEVSQEEIDPALGQKTAPASHPISIRLQAWVDRFDSTVRAVVKQKTGQTLVAPHPQVRLVVDPEVNAYIMGLPTCIASAPAPAAGLDPLYVFTSPNSVSRSADGFCLESINWPASPTRLDWLNRLNAGNPNLTTPGAPGLVTAQGSDAITIGYGQPGETPLRVAKVAGISAVSLVNVNAALVSELSEKGAAVVIAHELGHYYRAHMATASAFRYEFWFDRDRQIPERPVGVANQAEYREQYDRIKLPRFTVPGQQIHPRLGSSLVAWAKDIKTTPGHVCETVTKTVASWPPALTAELTMATGAEHDLSGAARRAYLDLEKQASTCIKSIKLTNDAAPTIATPWATTNVSRAWFVSRIPEPMKSSLVGVDLTASTTLSDLLDKLTTKAKAIDAEAPEFLKRLADNQIGLYTGEQEADEISFELASRVGLTSADVYGSYTELMHYVERVSAPSSFDVANDSMSAAECEALLAKGFKDGDKNVHVGLGTLDDPHHALCYRLFNLYRENEAHHYVPAQTPNIPTGGPAWADLQKQAKDLLAGGPTTTPTDPGKGGGGKKTPPTTPTDPTGGGDEGPVGGDEGGEDGDVASSDPTTGGATTTTKKTTGCSAAAGSNGSDLTSFGVVLAAVIGLARRRRRK